MNPCPCGAVGGRCSCTATQAQAYARRISGPLLDRIDLRVEVGAVSYAELTARPGEPSARSGQGSSRLARASSTERRGRSGHQRPPGRRSPAAPGLPDAQGRALLAVRSIGSPCRLAGTTASSGWPARWPISIEGGIEGHHVAEALQFRGYSRRLPYLGVELRAQGLIQRADRHVP